jgi:hypothetical protein
VAGIQRFDSRRAVIAAAVLAVLAVVALALVALGGGDDDDDGAAAPVGAPGEVFLEPAADIGPAPFTKTVAHATPPKSPGSAPAATTVPPDAPTTATQAMTTTTAGGGPVVVASRPGGTPGLYGGTRDDASCDPALLVSYLEDPANAAQARAWAGVLGIDASEIRAYVATLTPVVLTADTRVTNHGYADGRATPRQSVFEAGTAVLVDDQGVPRVRCACGNPLLEPVPATSTVTYTGPAWDAFAPSLVVVVVAAPAPLETLVLVDVETGVAFERPVGTDGSRDADAPPGVLDGTSTGTAPTAPPTVGPSTSGPLQTVGSTAPASTAAASTGPTTGPPTTAPTTVATTTTTGAPVDVSREGVLTASSEFPGGEFPAGLALDGDVTTSWFSAGDADGPTSELGWTSGRSELIAEIRVVPNAAHARPDFRRGFGFEAVTIQVLDAAGAPQFEQTHDLPGTPDPEIVVAPNVRGTSVLLRFEGHEDPTCGGIAELVVTARR